MKKFKARFEFIVNETLIDVEATCTDVNVSGIEGLTLQFFTGQGNPLEVSFNPDFFAEVEMEAHEALLAVKEGPVEVDFNEDGIIDMS